MDEMATMGRWREKAGGPRTESQDLQFRSMAKRRSRLRRGRVRKAVSGTSSWRARTEVSALTLLHYYGVTGEGSCRDAGSRRQVHATGDKREDVDLAQKRAIVNPRKCRLLSEHLTQVNSFRLTIVH